jgi:hypothetical protein
MTLYLESRHSSTWATPPVPFAPVILEMGSWELVAGLSLNRDPTDLSLSSS